MAEATPPAGGEAPPVETPPAGNEPPATPPAGGEPPAEPPSGGSDFSALRDALEDESLKKQAMQYNSFEDMVKSNLKMRQNGADKSFKVPGEDASEVEKAEFKKVMGIPNDENGYEFPEIPEGFTKETYAERTGKWGKVFQEAGVTGDGAKVLMAAVQAEAAEVAQGEIDADNKFAEESKTLLEKEWGKDYDANKEFADRAIASIFGDTYEDVKHIKMADGKFIMDHPAFIRAFGIVGREMTEGGVTEPTLTPTQIQSARETADSCREKRLDAMNKGNNEQARYWDEQERIALATLEKQQPAVGEQGRNV